MAATASSASTIVRFETVLGDFDVRLYDTATPITVDNFMGYVNRGDYDGSVVHRNAQTFAGDPFVVQGGNWTWNSLIQEVVAVGEITNEPGISNLRGTLALARRGGEVNSGSTNWFVNMDDNTNLDTVDEGFTVFGRVLGDGMEVLDAISMLTNINLSPFGNELPVLEGYEEGDPVFPSDVVLVNSITQLNFADGDYNFDGNVDLRDYNVWRDALGSTTDAAADGNGNGIVDEADYSVWLAGMQAGGGLEGGATVPEPATVLLAGGALALLLGARRCGYPNIGSQKLDRF